MKFVSLSYVVSDSFHDPASWLERVKPYGKVLEALAVVHDVISFEQINYEGKLQLNGVEYQFIRLKNRRFPSALHRKVRDLNPDVVIVHGLSFPLQVLQLRRALGKEVIILAQSHADRIPLGWRRWMQRIVDSSINAYLFVSTDMAQKWIEKRLIRDSRKIKEVMVGASVFCKMDRNSAALKTKVKGRPIFLFVGRIDDNKDPFTLIRAFLTFSRVHPTASLYLILQNPEKFDELKKSFNEGLEQNIFLVGKIQHAEMQTWYNSADFIISTSHAEAFGMAVAEAMSCGCFPIVTNIPSFRKLTDNASCGILFEPGDTGQLAAALDKATSLDLDVERKKILTYYHTHLSAKAIAEQIYKAATTI